MTQMFPLPPLYGGGLYTPELRISWGDGRVAVEADYLGETMDDIKVDPVAGSAFTVTRVWELHSGE
jgi:hypothetical protein